MSGRGFRRFVAVFVGILLALAVGLAVVTSDESMIGTAAGVGLLYAIYLVQFIRKEKERGEMEKQRIESPLLRRK